MLAPATRRNHIGPTVGVVEPHADDPQRAS